MSRKRVNPTCPICDSCTTVKQKSSSERGVRQVYFVYKCVRCGQELAEDYRGKEE